MLQPEQLRRVRESFSQDVAAFHSFFTKAGIRTDVVDALPTVAYRVTKDRGFQRDLMSYVWVLLHAHGAEVSSADLLGIVAVAAAGPVLAATARDSDAHDLLSFLLDARKSFESRPSLPAATSAAGVSKRTNNERLTHRTSYPSTWSLMSTGRASVLALIVLCVGVAWVATTWFHRPSSDPSATPPSQPVVHLLPAQRQAAVISALPSSTSVGVRTSTAVGAGPRHDLPLRTHAVKADASPRRTLGDVSELIAPFALSGSSAVRPSVAATGQPAESATYAATTNPSSGQARGAPTPAGQWQGTRLAIPSAVLSRQLGARALPPDSVAEDRSYDAKYPRLLRRHPLLPLAAEHQDATEQMASNQPPAIFRTGSGATAPMVVRPTSLGTMAANVLYSPAPAYPTAAAAARIQGEVKIQAEVDRDGNVAAVRVISGPVLLRDAAADAVQRWRYRPYMAAGRPIAMSATAVLDFELQ